MLSCPILAFALQIIKIIEEFYLIIRGLYVIQGRAASGCRVLRMMNCF